MLDVPLETGVIAAFLFLIFELVVFPALIYSTSTIASVHLYHRAKKGDEVRVDTLKFPYWNEGLLHRQRTHVFLLLFRMVAIAIPVYLDTRLEARRGVVRNTYRHAFAVVPKQDWLSYENKLNERITDLNEQTKVVYDRCTKVDADGWRKASLANVSFHRNGRQRVHCIPGTEKRVFRSVGNEDALRNYSKYEKEVVLKLSWLEGPLEAFPNSSFSRFGSLEVSHTIHYYLITNWTVVGESGFHCFPKTTIMWKFPEHEISPFFFCHGITGTNVEYYYAYEEFLEPDVLTSKAVKELLTSKTGILKTSLRYVETLQFESHVMISAAHISNSEPEPELRFRSSLCEECVHPLVAPRSQFYSILGTLLYTRMDNASLQVPADQFSRTVISNQLLILGALEVSVVLLFAVFVWLYLCWTRNDVQKPNTLNGLSEVWAVSNDSSNSPRKRERRRITLRMRKGAQGEHQNNFVPLGMTAGCVGDDD